MIRKRTFCCECNCVCLHNSSATYRMCGTGVPLTTRNKSDYVLVDSDEIRFRCLVSPVHSFVNHYVLADSDSESSRAAALPASPALSFKLEHIELPLVRQDTDLARPRRSSVDDHQHWRRAPRRRRQLRAIGSRRSPRVPDLHDLQKRERE